MSSVIVPSSLLADLGRPSTVDWDGSGSDHESPNQPDSPPNVDSLPTDSSPTPAPALASVPRLPLSAASLVPSQLVGRPSSKPYHPLERYSYTSVGSNSIFVSQPSIIHFAGFEPNRIYSQRIMITNKSGESQRIHLMNPETSFFRVKYNGNKRGWIPPGLHECLIVEFLPSEVQYYTDQIRIHSPGGNFCIPIHAYPTMTYQKHAEEVTVSIINTANKKLVQREEDAAGEAADQSEAVASSQRFQSVRSSVTGQIAIPPRSRPFPTFIDLGTTIVGRQTIHIEQIQNPSPVAFDYYLRVLNETSAAEREDTDNNRNGEFAGKRSEFIVEPINGEVPPRGTVGVKVVFSPLKPVTSSIQLLVSLSELNFQPYTCTIVARAVNPDFQITSRDLGLPSDAFVKPKSALQRAQEDWEKSQSQVALQKRTKDRSQSSQRNRSRDQGKSADEILVDHHRIPKHIMSHGSVNAVFLQRPGKLRIRDLRAAVEEHSKTKAETEEKVKLAQSSISLESELSAGAVSERDLAKTLQARQYRLLDASDSPDLETRFPGETRQIRELVFERLLNQVEKREKKVEINPSEQRIGALIMDRRQRLEIEEDREGEKAELLARKRWEDRNRIRNEKSESGGAVSAIESVAEFESAANPAFNLSVVDDWEFRSRSLKRFTTAVSELLIRRRIERRLEAAEAQFMDKQSKLAEESELDRKLRELLPQLRLSADKVLFQPAVVRGSELPLRTAVPIEPLQLTFAPLHSFTPLHSADSRSSEIPAYYRSLSEYFPAAQRQPYEIALEQAAKAANAAPTAAAAPPKQSTTAEPLAVGSSSSSQSSVSVTQLPPSSVSSSVSSGSIPPVYRSAPPARPHESLRSPPEFHGLASRLSGVESSAAFAFRATQLSAPTNAFFLSDPPNSDSHIALAASGDSLLGTSQRSRPVRDPASSLSLSHSSFSVQRSLDPRDKLDDSGNFHLDRSRFPLPSLEAARTLFDSDQNAGLSERQSLVNASDEQSALAQQSPRNKKPQNKQTQNNTVEVPPIQTAAPLPPPAAVPVAVSLTSSVDVPLAGRRTDRLDAIANSISESNNKLKQPKLAIPHNIHSKTKQ